MDQRDEYRSDASAITCPGCGYDLRAHLTARGAVCPECGESWSRDDVRRLATTDVAGFTIVLFVSQHNHHSVAKFAPIAPIVIFIQN